MLRRDQGDRTEFITLSLWDSVDAIRAFTATTSRPRSCTRRTSATSSAAYRDSVSVSFGCFRSHTSNAIVDAATRSLLHILGQQPHQASAVILGRGCAAAGLSCHSARAAL
jgi:hypothetical protein